MRKSLGLVDCKSAPLSLEQAEGGSETDGNGAAPRPSKRPKLVNKAKQLNVLEVTFKLTEGEYRGHVAELTRMTEEGKSDSQSRRHRVYLLDQVNCPIS